MMWKQRLGAVARIASGQLAKRLAAGQPRRTARPTPVPTARSTPSGQHAAPAAYPGDFTGPLTWEYAPHADGRPDPGEVVWAWVPYEEDHRHGKDRPALVVGHDGPWLLALPLTSKDHDRDAAEEASVGRHWVDVGSGAWDRSGRPSEARVDRVVRLDPAAVRREGAALSRDVFDSVMAALQRARGA